MIFASVVSVCALVIRISSEPSPLIVPGENAVARLLLHRHRLAGDRRLVDRGFADGHDAIERHARAGFHGDGRAHGHFGDGHFAEIIAVLEQRRLGRELHERLHGLARPREAEGFEQFREREEERDRRAFGQLADGHRARDGHGHQHVHVEREPPHRAPRLRRDEPAARDDRDAKGDVRRERGAEFHPLREQAEAREDARHGDGNLPHPLRSLHIRVRIVAIARGLHARARDRADELLRRHALVVEKRDLSAHEIHPHFAHAFERTKHLLQRLDFIRAIHPGDAQGRLDVALRVGVQRDVLRFVARLVIVTVVIVMFVAHKDSDLARAKGRKRVN